MKNLTILGSLPEKEEDYNKYKTIIELSKKYFDNINSPIDTKKFKGDNFERFERAVKTVKESDLIIGELSLPSTGQGIEIGIAYTLEIPLVILAKKGAKVSGLIKGNPFVKEIIYYSDFEELKYKLSNLFSKYY